MSAMSEMIVQCSGGLGLVLDDEHGVFVARHKQRLLLRACVELEQRVHHMSEVDDRRAVTVRLVEHVIAEQLYQIPIAGLAPTLVPAATAATAAHTAGTRSGCRRRTGRRVFGSFVDEAHFNERTGEAPVTHLFGELTLLIVDVAVRMVQFAHQPMGYHLRERVNRRQILFRRFGKQKRH